MVCLLAAPWVQLSVSVGNGWPHNVLRHHWLMSISCHFWDCKALLVTSLTHVSGAIASVQTFTLLPLRHLVRVWRADCRIASKRKLKLSTEDSEKMKICLSRWGKLVVFQEAGRRPTPGTTSVNLVRKTRKTALVNRLSSQKKQGENRHLELLWWT